MILDTNALSAFVDGDPALESILSKVHSLSIPLIVLGEYRYGILRSLRKKEYENWLTQNLNLFDLIYLTENTAQHYAEIRLELKENGQPIPENDIWISALGRENSLPIITKDRHFSFVKGLIVQGF